MGCSDAAEATNAPEVGINSRNRRLDRFSNPYALANSVKGGFFLRKKPFIIVLSVHSNWRTAIMRAC